MTRTAFHDAEAAAAVAALIIADLAGPRRDVLRDLCAKRYVDFVFVEEGADCELRERYGAEDRATYAACCGMVFLWLRREHGVEPPAWYAREDAADEDIEACPGCGCMPGDGRTPGCTHPGGCGYMAGEAGA